MRFGRCELTLHSPSTRVALRSLIARDDALTCKVHESQSAGAVHAHRLAEGSKRVASVIPLGRCDTKVAQRRAKHMARLRLKLGHFLGHQAAPEEFDFPAEIRFFVGRRFP